jgi:ABC-2 type transport system permease protein
MVVLARAAFGLSFLPHGTALAPFLAVLFLTGIAFDVAAAAIVLRLGPASEWLA